MKNMFSQFTDVSAWLKLSLVILGVLWGIWLSGTWPTNPIVEYVPPKFEELKVAEGTLSFTRRSKSSGGEIELHLVGGSTLLLHCNPPNTLPDACYRKDESGGISTDYKDKLNKHLVTAWYQSDAEVANSGRIYQMQVDGKLFFNYPEQVGYYVKHYQSGGGRNGYFGLMLFFLTVLVVTNLRKKLKVAASN